MAKTHKHKFATIKEAIRYFFSCIPCMLIFAVFLLLCFSVRSCVKNDAVLKMFHNKTHTVETVNNK